MSKIEQSIEPIQKYFTPQILIDKNFSQFQFQFIDNFIKR